MASMERSRDMPKCPLSLFTRLESKIRKRSSVDVFECKTCQRQFPSFQALGGHRASHKRPRVVSDPKYLTLVTKPKMHECTVCGLEFSMGQALGGHMRRHRALFAAETFPEFRVVSGHNHHVEVAPLMRRSNSCNKRVFGLDLNLTPLENDLVVVLGKMAPKVDVFV